MIPTHISYWNDCHPSTCSIIWKSVTEGSRSMLCLYLGSQRKILRFIILMLIEYYLDISHQLRAMFEWNFNILIHPVETEASLQIQISRLEFLVWQAGRSTLITTSDGVNGAWKLNYKERMTRSWYKGGFLMARLINYTSDLQIYSISPNVGNLPI